MGQEVQEILSLAAPEVSRSDALGFWRAPFSDTSLKKQKQKAYLEGKTHHPVSVIPSYYNNNYIYTASCSTSLKTLNVG